MSVEYVVQVIFGLCAGGFAAAGLFAFITTLGIVMRLAQVTHTADHICLYENCIVVGAIVGTVVDCFQVSLNIGSIGAVLFGLFSGVFVGCLVGAVAEILNAFPVFFRRLHLHQGIAWVIMALAFGKFVGILIQYFGA